MQDSTLLWTATIVSLIGIAGLYILSSSIEIDPTGLGEVQHLEDDSEVMVEGTVNSHYSNGNVTILSIMKMEEVKAVVFENISVAEGTYIQVVGQVKEYEGEKEILVERVRVVG